MRLFFQRLSTPGPNPPNISQNAPPPSSFWIYVCSIPIIRIATCFHQGTEEETWSTQRAPPTFLKNTPSMEELVWVIFPIVSTCLPLRALVGPTPHLGLLGGAFPSSDVFSLTVVEPRFSCFFQELSSCLGFLWVEHSQARQRWISCAIGPTWANRGKQEEFDKTQHVFYVCLFVFMKMENGVGGF